MRSVFPALLGNEPLKRIIGNDIQSGTIGHAYILEGPAGSGKHTVAMAVAAALACENKRSPNTALPCGKCLFCRKVENGVSPDIIYIRRSEGRATVGVDVIRTLREDLYIIPNENERKIYIIEDADLMTLQAQNALLLSLEEPPDYVTIFLLAENASSLLETIRSRAPVLRMELFDTETIARILKEERRYAALSTTEPDYFAEAVTASGGALGQARSLLNRSSEDASEHRALRTDTLGVLPLLFSRSSRQSTQMLLSLPKSREEVLALFRYIILALRDMIAVKKNAAVPLLFFLSKEECNNALDKVGVRRIVNAYNALMRAYFDLQSNASVQTVCTALLMHKF